MCEVALISPIDVSVVNHLKAFGFCQRYSFNESIISYQISLTHVPCCGHYPFMLHGPYLLTQALKYDFFNRVVLGRRRFGGKWCH